MLKDFYSILSVDRNDNLYSAAIVFNPHHPVYEGHFSGFPIAPGVMLTHLIKELCETELKRKLTMERAGDIKFLKMIIPTDGSPYTVKIDFNFDADVVDVKAMISREDSIYLKLNARFV